jgi:hypothetical protein
MHYTCNHVELNYKQSQPRLKGVYLLYTLNKHIHNGRQAVVVNWIIAAYPIRRPEGDACRHPQLGLH